LKIAFAFAACLIGVACDRIPGLDAAATETILVDAQLILDNASIGTLERSAWPESFSTLSPKAVRVAEEGLFIVTYSFYVEESGIFVPRDLAEFEWEPRSDPSFLPIGGGLFEYHFTG
jgi:hypothetical protein